MLLPSSCFVGATCIRYDKQCFLVGSFLLDVEHEVGHVAVYMSGSGADSFKTVGGQHCRRGTLTSSVQQSLFTTTAFIPRVPVFA